MKIVALLQTFNERRFVANCIEHLNEHGAAVYLVDNASTDDTVEIAERYIGRGVVGIEQLPRDGSWNLYKQLERKEQLAAELDADWLMHVDADEIREPPDSRQSLAEAFRAADEMGFNALNFLEFAFVPTAEQPDHDHPNYERTMQWYYPLVPDFPHRRNAWKRQDGPVDLVSSRGHRVDFPGLSMAPRNLYMRHFLFLSVAHAAEKYNVDRQPNVHHQPGDWRKYLDVDRIELPSERLLRRSVPGKPLDRTEPLDHHLPIPRPSPKGQQVQGGVATE
jgi:glycosyltransferase involved in cell wall biosynthesis